MLHVDVPTRSELDALIAHRGPACVSIQLPTTPLGGETRADRIALDNLAAKAVAQLDAVTAPADAGRRLRRRGMAELMTRLVDDEGFWTRQAHGLAVFVSEDRIRTFRLAESVTPSVAVADRFHVRPLLRARTLGRTAAVLALSEDQVRLLEVAPELPVATVRVAGLPRDLEDAVGRGGLASHAPRARVVGSHAEKVRLAPYARVVDAALRGVLGGRDVPLILAAAAPLDAIFRAACSYPHLSPAAIAGNPDLRSDRALGAAARRVLAAAHDEEVRRFAALFDAQGAAGYTTTDIAHAARAATYGAVAAIAVAVDAAVAGDVDDAEGVVTFAPGAGAETHGVVDEIAGRVFTSGGRVLALPRDRIPGGGELAAVLRYAL
jgi:hypothetical protein